VYGDRGLCKETEGWRNTAAPERDVFEIFYFYKGLLSFDDLFVSFLTRSSSGHNGLL
jgi:hypothetical protein